MRRLALFFLALFLSGIAYGQQSAIYSQYMFNGLAINPAYAGYDGMLSMTALARIQSVGLEGSPNTQTFSAHTPLFNDRVGVGLQFFHEQVGVTDITGVYASYSYKIYYKQYTISFGLQGGVNYYKTNFSSLITANPGDPVFSEDTKSTTPNVGSGIILSSKNLYASISMTQMLSVGKDEKIIVEEKPLIIYGGYVIKLAPGLKLKPSMLAKLVNGNPVEWNINAHLLLKEILWVGVSLRPVNSISMMFQLQITEQLAFGYSYDITMGELSTIESGSHELMLNYKFRFSKQGVVSPRYF